MANIQKIASLFSGNMATPAQLEEKSAMSQMLTIRGKLPFDGLREWLDPGFVAVVDSVRNHPTYGRIFAGDLSRYGGDHSQADLALCGEFARQGLKPEQIDMALRASGLMREKWERDDYRERTIKKAMEGLPKTTMPERQAVRGVELSLDQGRLDFGLQAPPPRNWNLHGLLPAAKAAVLGGFGGVSKTQFAVQLAISFALGKSFMGRSVNQGSSFLFFGEEDRDEVMRRVNADLRNSNYTSEDVETVRERVFAFPLVGQDFRLTKRENSDLKETSIVDNILSLASQRDDLRLIVIDHLALVHGGEFNAKEDAAITMRVVNRIAHQTGASVIVIAHTQKSANDKLESDHTMIAGSTAFVDQARAVWILATMRPDDTKTFKIDDTARKDYVSLAVVKSNYGRTGDVFWFKRQGFDEVGLLRSVELVPPIPTLKGEEALKRQILEDLKKSPGRYSLTKYRDTKSGNNGFLKASKSRVEQALQALIDDGRLISRAPTGNERKQYQLTGQVKFVLEVSHV